MGAEVPSRFRGGIVFKAHRLCVSLNSGLESIKAEEVPSRWRTQSRRTRTLRLRPKDLLGPVTGRGSARAEDAQGTPTQSHISPSIL